MYDLMRDFDNLFELGFGRPLGLRFETNETKDMMPAHWKSVKDKDGNREGYKCVCRTVGIAPEDVKIKITDTGIVVEGKTKYEDEEYKTHFELPIAESVIADIESIDYKTVNGITHIYLKIKEPEKKKISINRI